MLDRSLVEISTCLLVTLNIFMCVYNFWLKKKKGVLTSGPNSEIPVSLKISKLILLKTFLKTPFETSKKLLIQ